MIIKCTNDNEYDDDDDDDDQKQKIQVSFLSACVCVLKKKLNNEKNSSIEQPTNLKVVFFLDQE